MDLHRVMDIIQKIKPKQRPPLCKLACAWFRIISFGSISVLGQALPSGLDNLGFIKHAFVWYQVKLCFLLSCFKWEEIIWCCPNSIVMIVTGPPHWSPLSLSLSDKHMSHKDEAGPGQKCSSSCSPMWPHCSGSSLQLYHLPHCDSSSEWQDVLLWVLCQRPGTAAGFTGHRKDPECHKTRWLHFSHCTSIWLHSHTHTGNTL